METRAPGAVDPAGTGEGPYLRRAQALLAARAELFPAGPARLAGVAGPPRDRPETRHRRASRQLTLPLPRERPRRRARMVG